MNSPTENIETIELFFDEDGSPYFGVLGPIEAANKYSLEITYIPESRATQRGFMVRGMDAKMVIDVLYQCRRRRHCGPSPEKIYWRHLLSIKDQLAYAEAARAAREARTHASSSADKPSAF
jgi:hypothetical protein